MSVLDACNGNPEIEIDCNSAKECVDVVERTKRKDLRFVFFWRRRRSPQQRQPILILTSHTHLIVIQISSPLESKTPNFNFFFRFHLPLSPLHLHIFALPNNTPPLFRFIPSLIISSQQFPPPLLIMTEVVSPIAPAPTESMDKLSLESHSPTTSSPISSSNNTTLVNHNEPLTVFHDPKNFNIKHPLMNTWTLWFTKTPSSNGPKESWADLLKEVITFDSVEEFWG
jgi:hypothetical protein